MNRKLDFGSMMSPVFKQLLAVTLPWCFIPILFCLSNNAYPWLRPETIVIYSIVAIFAFLLAYARCKIIVNKLYLFDAGLITVIASFLPIKAALWAFLYIFFGAVIIFLFLDKKTWLLLSWCGIAFVIGQLVAPKGLERIAGSDTHANEIQTTPHTKAKNLPVVIHIILDEHAGIADLNSTDAKHELGTNLEQFYQRYGFNVYPNAYSRYTNTVNSIPNLLNFTENNIHGGYLRSKDYNASNGGELKENRYFELLHKQGYRIRVYQPAFIGYCKSKVPIDRCVTYSSWLARVIAETPLPVHEKVIYLTASLLNSSAIIKWLKLYYFGYVRSYLLNYGYDPSWIRYEPHSTAVPALAVMDNLENAVIREHAGMAYFVHLLWPHSPYVYAANCSLKPKVTDWQMYFDRYPIFNTPQTWRQRQDDYHEQISCIAKRLGQFFDRLKQQGIYEHAIIIIHGDHGSRIVFNSLDLSAKYETVPRDYLYGFATLFAYKAPRTLTINKQAFVPITTLFSDLASHWFDVQLPTLSKNDFVYLVPEQIGDELVPVPAIQSLWLSQSNINQFKQHTIAVPKKE